MDAAACERLQSCALTSVFMFCHGRRVTDAITIREVEELTGRGWRTIRRWVVSAGFPAGNGKKGQPKTYARSEVEAWIAANPGLIATAAAAREEPRAASEGVLPASTKFDPGSHGYRGYVYQAQVSCWVGLYLILDQRACDGIVIEPPTHEDIEASLRDPENASLALGAPSAGIRLHLQVKLRSSGNWKPGGLGELLAGKLAGGTGRRRKRPLQMLSEDPDNRYLLITNAGLDDALHQHIATNLSDFPDAISDLPERCRDQIRDRSTRQQIGRRIGILAGLTEEILTKRVGDILMLHGNVPQPNLDRCHEDILQFVWARIRGMEAGQLTRDDLMHAIVANGGSPYPQRHLSFYVPPRSLDRIRDRLAKQHAVILIGPSGTGKTLTGDLLQHELATAPVPFSVTTEVGGPGIVRTALTRPGNQLFHLRDPWGSNRLEPAADQWSNELPKIIGERSPDRKFVITSRSDVFDLSSCDRQLHPLVVRIDPEDYGPSRIAEIYDRISAQLEGPARSLARRFRKRALPSFQRPYEVYRFLMMLAAEDALHPRQVWEIVRDAQIDSIASVVKDMVLAHPAGVDAAAILWALITARKAIPTDFLRTVMRRFRRDHGSRPDVEGLSSFLEAGGNLRRGDTIEFAHPRVEEGLAMALQHAARPAEDTLARLIETLLQMDGTGSSWGAETVLSVVRAAKRLPELDLDFNPTVFDAYLLGRVADADGYGKLATLTDLAEFGSGESDAAKIARLLIRTREKDEKRSWPAWECPDIPPPERERIRRGPDTRLVLSALVESLPFSTDFYDDVLIDLLLDLGLVPGAFARALDTALSHGSVAHNLGVIVAGACRSRDSGFEDTLDALRADEAETDEWFADYRETLRRANEFEVDAALAERYTNEPSERYYNSSEGYRAAAIWRIGKDGIDWLRTHPLGGKLASAASQHFRSMGVPAPTGLLPMLAELSGCPEREDALWACAARRWEPALLDALRLALSMSGLRWYDRRALAEALCGMPSGALELLAEVAEHAFPVRRIELGVDLLRLDGLRSPFKKRQAPVSSLARAYRALVSPPEQDLIDAIGAWRESSDLAETAASLSTDAVGLLARLMDDSICETTFDLIGFAASRGIAIDALAETLLDLETVEAGCSAMFALSLQDDPAARSVAWKGLKHPDHSVRRAALNYLVRGASPAERIDLIAMSEDPGAYVRLDWAELMTGECWPEAESALVRLLSDDRDFADGTLFNGNGWARHQIARQAAHALGRYPAISDTTLAALLAAAEAQRADPFVACAALSALATSEGEAVAACLRQAMEDGGVDNDDRYRPRAISAAWAFFDRVVGQLPLSEMDRAVLEIAGFDPNPRIAGPAILTLGISAADDIGLMATRLDASGLTARRELLEISAAAAGRGTARAGQPDLTLLAMIGRGEEPDPVLPAMAALKRWVGAIKPDDDVAYVTAWVGNLLVMKSDISDKIGLRDFNMPRSVPIATLRNLAGQGEEVGLTDTGR